MVWMSWQKCKYWWQSLGLSHTSIKTLPFHILTFLSRNAKFPLLKSWENLIQGSNSLRLFKKMWSSCSPYVHIKEILTVEWCLVIMFYRHIVNHILWNPWNKWYILPYNLYWIMSSKLFWGCWAWCLFVAAVFICLHHAFLAFHLHSVRFLSFKVFKSFLILLICIKCIPKKF